MRKIVAAGSILVDKINAIDAYPNAGELTQIRSLAQVTGGLVPNTGCDIHILDPEIPVSAFGAVGDDDLGKFAVSRLEAAGLDVSGVVVKKGETSFTLVMSVATGERTFFTFPGASADWGYDDFPFHLVNEGDIVLLGYFLLLAKVDSGDGLRILKELKRRGAETAIDLVSENSDRYGLVREVLPFVDHLIVNEVEAERIAFGCGEGGRPLREIAEKLMELGVSKRVVIHMPEKGVSLLSDGTWTECASHKLPEGFIKGKTGAGDAYCAGALVGIYRGFPERKILETGATAALGALSAPGATEGMRSLPKLEEIATRIDSQC